MNKQDFVVGVIATGLFVQFAAPVLEQATAGEIGQAHDNFVCEPNEEPIQQVVRGQVIDLEKGHISEAVDQEDLVHPLKFVAGLLRSIKREVDEHGHVTNELVLSLQRRAQSQSSRWKLETNTQQFETEFQAISYVIMTSMDDEKCNRKGVDGFRRMVPGLIGRTRESGAGTIFYPLVSLMIALESWSPLMSIYEFQSMNSVPPQLSDLALSGIVKNPTLPITKKIQYANRLVAYEMKHGRLEEAKGLLHTVLHNETLESDRQIGETTKLLFRLFVMDRTSRWEYGNVWEGALNRISTSRPGKGEESAVAFANLLGFVYKADIDWTMPVDQTLDSIMDLNARDVSVLVPSAVKPSRRRDVVPNAGRQMASILSFGYLDAPYWSGKVDYGSSSVLKDFIELLKIVADDYDRSGAAYRDDAFSRYAFVWRFDKTDTDAFARAVRFIDPDEFETNHGYRIFVEQSMKEFLADFGIGIEKADDRNLQAGSCGEGQSIEVEAALNQDQILKIFGTMVEAGAHFRRYQNGLLPLVCQLRDEEEGISKLSRYYREWNDQMRWVEALGQLATKYQDAESGRAKCLRSAMAALAETGRWNYDSKHYEECSLYSAMFEETIGGTECQDECKVAIGKLDVWAELDTANEKREPGERTSGYANLLSKGKIVCGVPEQIDRNGGLPHVDIFRSYCNGLVKSLSEVADRTIELTFHSDKEENLKALLEQGQLDIGFSSKPWTIRKFEREKFVLLGAITQDPIYLTTPSDARDKINELRSRGMDCAFEKCRARPVGICIDESVVFTESVKSDAFNVIVQQIASPFNLVPRYYRCSVREEVKRAFDFYVVSKRQYTNVDGKVMIEGRLEELSYISGLSSSSAVRPMISSGNKEWERLARKELLYAR